MSDFLEKTKALRPDIGDWVVHFTKGSWAEGREALWPFVTFERIHKMEGHGTSDERMVRQLKDLFGATD